MPKELSELEKAQEALEAKRTGLEKWVKSQVTAATNKVLTTLRAEPGKVFTPEELFGKIFGEKKCPMEGKPMAEVPPDHEFDCGPCRQKQLWSEIGRYLVGTKQVTVYQLGHQVWLGIAQKENK